MCFHKGNGEERQIFRGGCQNHGTALCYEYTAILRSSKKLRGGFFRIPWHFRGPLQPRSLAPFPVPRDFCSSSVSLQHWTQRHALYRATGAETQVTVDLNVLLSTVEYLLRFRLPLRLVERTLDQIKDLLLVHFPSSKSSIASPFMTP